MRPGVVGAGRSPLEEGGEGGEEGEEEEVHLGQIACFVLISPSFNEHLHSQNQRMGYPILSHFTQ